jgi:hypothetical protein
VRQLSGDAALLIAGQHHHIKASATARRVDRRRESFVMIASLKD